MHQSHCRDCSSLDAEWPLKDVSHTEKKCQDKGLSRVSSVIESYPPFPFNQGLCIILKCPQSLCSMNSQLQTAPQHPAANPRPRAITIAMRRRDQEESRTRRPLVYLLQLYMVVSAHVAKPASPHRVVNKKHHLQIGCGGKQTKRDHVEVSVDLANVFLTEFPLSYLRLKSTLFIQYFGIMGGGSPC